MEVIYTVAAIIGVLLILIIGYVLLEYSEIKRERQWEEERLERERKEFEAIWGKKERMI